MSAAGGPRLAVGAAAAALMGLQLVGDVGALLTGGVVVLLLAGTSLVLSLRRRPRGWVIGAAALAGVALFVLPWSLFVAAQTRAAGGQAGLWSWAAIGLSTVALGASAWLLSSQPRGRLAVDRAYVVNLAGVLTLLAGLSAAVLAVGSAVAGTAPGLVVGLLAVSWVLLRTLRVAEPGRHLADVVVAASAFAGLVWWVFVGTLQGATRGVGLLVVVAVVFLALVARAGRAVDATPPVPGRLAPSQPPQPKRPEM